MRGFVLQDWVTIRGGSTSVVTQVIQNEASWLSLEMYQDAIFLLQVSELTLAGTSPTLTLNLETSPIKDESLWMPMGNPSAGVSITSSIVGVVTPQKVILSNMTPSAGIPLSRWVRWRLIPGGTSITPPWDVTFRVLVSCNQLFYPVTGGYGGYGGGLGGSGWGQQMR
jgi:hypothetical protein